MVATVGSIRVLLAAEYGTYQDGLRRAASTTERESQRMGRSIQNVDRSTSALSRTMAGIRGREFRVLSLAALRAKDSVERLRGTLLATAALFGGFGAAFTLKGISEYADTYTKVGNRLRVVKGEAQELSDIEEKIFQTAQRSRAQYEATGVLFARIATSARRLGVAQADVLRVTETIQKAFVIGGSTPIEAAQSSIQLSQGIASNRLQGDELRSVLENPALGQLLADRITEGDIGKLRKIASEGQLTAGVVIRAFKGASEEIDRLFAGAQQTIAESFVKIDNAILKYIGTSENANKASRATVTAMNAIAENFDTIGDAISDLAVAFGAFLGGRAFGGAAKALMETSRASLIWRNTTRAAAAETLASSQAELRAASIRAASAKAYYAMTQAGVVSAKTRIAAGRQLQSALYAEAMAFRNAQAAVVGANAAIAATRPLAMAGATAMRAFSASVAFLGGPVGASLVALTAVWAVMSARTAEAEERSSRYADAIKKAGEESQGATPKIFETAAAMASFKQSATEAEQAMAMRGARDDLSALESQLRAIGANLVQYPIAKAFIDGKMSLDEFLKATDKLDRTSRYREKLITDMQQVAREIEAARGTLQGLILDFGRLGDAAQNIGRGDLASALTAQATQFMRGSQAYQDALAAAGEGMTKATEDWREAREDAVKEAFKQNRLDPIMARMFVDAIEGVTPNNVSSRKTPGETAAEKLKKALADLDYQILASELPELEKKTIEAAQSAGVAEADIRAFIASIKAGETLPPVLESIRSKLEQIAMIEVNKALGKMRWEQAVRFLSEIDQKTVEVARSAGMAEEKIRSFISAVSGGEMSAAPEEMAALRMEMERIAVNDRMIDLADGMASAFGDFFKEAGRGAESFGDQLRQLAVRLIEVAQEVLIIQPLVAALKNIFLGGFGGNTLPPIQLGLPVAHSGWNVGEGTPPARRTVPVSALANAQRFHDGLAPDEFAAILQQGEAVIPKSAVRSATRAVGAAASGAPMEVGVRVYVDDEGALRAMVDRRTGERIGEYAQGSYNRHIQNQNRAKRTRALR